MASYPFSEIMVGDKFLFVDDANLIIKVKTGPSSCRLTGDVYVGDGEVPISSSAHNNGETGEVSVDPKTFVVKLLDLAEMAADLQHQIWDASIQEGVSVSELIDDLIEQTAEAEDDDDAFIHKIATLIRDTRNGRANGKDGTVFEE